VVLHASLVSLTASKGMDTSSVAEVPPSAAALVQFFMTFFLTFYNRHCFARYELLYDNSMNIVDGCLLFVHEMTISLNEPELVWHRNLATKYILATVYIFFMTLTGGKLSPKEWTELARKGLLTKPETEALAAYPAGEVTLVLTVWAMIVVDDALEHDVCWQPHSQRIAHLHNRLNNAMLHMVSSCHTVAHTIAMPIPFPYYHLMNLVLVSNFLLFACVLALLQTYLTIVPFGAVIAVFLGLRNVATQLADPFGDDDVDFPVAHFINYCVDQTLCLLETFEYMDRGFLDATIEAERNFTDQQLTRAVDKKMLYKACGYKFLNEKYNWANNCATNKYEEHENALQSMQGVFQPVSLGEANLKGAMSADDIVEELEALFAETTKKRRALAQARLEIATMEADMKVQGVPLPGKKNVKAIEAGTQPASNDAEAVSSKERADSGGALSNGQISAGGVPEDVPALGVSSSAVPPMLSDPPFQATPTLPINEAVPVRAKKIHTITDIDGIEVEVDDGDDNGAVVDAPSVPIADPWVDADAVQNFSEARDLIKRTLEHAGLEQIQEEEPPRERGESGEFALPAPLTHGTLDPTSNALALQSTSAEVADELAIVPVENLSYSERRADDPRRREDNTARQRRGPDTSSGRSAPPAGSSARTSPGKDTSTFDNFEDARAMIRGHLEVAKPSSSRRRPSREGSREGSRAGSREGSRQGSRAGSRAGSR